MTLTCSLCDIEANPPPDGAACRLCKRVNLSSLAWRSWDEAPARAGTKVVFMASDQCSTFAALVVEDGPGEVTALHAEDGWDLKDALKGAIWIALPDDTPMDFME